MSRVNAVSDSSADALGRGRVLPSIISDFGPGDNKTVIRSVEELPAGRTLASAFLTVKANASDLDASALFKLEIGTIASAGGVITQVANSVGWLTFYLLPAHTQLAGVIAGAQFDIEVLDDQGHVYTLDRGRIQPTIPEVRTDAPHVAFPHWQAVETSQELPTGQARRIGWELLDDFFARDDYTIRRTVWIPAGRTLASLTFYAFTNPTDLAGSALVSAAATVTDNGSGDGIAAVTIALTEGQTNQLRDPRAWRAVATLDNGKKYTVRCGTIWAQDDVTDASTAAVATVVWDPTTESVGPGSAVVATVRCYSIGGAELIGRSITGVATDNAGIATVTPASGVSPLAVTVSGVADGEAHIAAQSGSVHATALDVTVEPQGVYGIISPDPILWLKPETVSGTVDGASVSTWPDSSPHGWDMTPMVSNGGGVAPKWDAAKGAVRFHGAGAAEALENAAFNSLASCAGYTLFVVSQEAANGGCVMSASSSDWWEGYTSAGRYRTDLGNFGWSSYFAFADLLKHIHETRYDGSQATNVLRLVQALDGTLPGETQFGIPSSFGSGGGMCVGHGSGLTFFNGWVSEILMFPGRLSDSDCTLVRTALGAKYGITV